MDDVRHSVRFEDLLIKRRRSQNPTSQQDDDALAHAHVIDFIGANVIQY